MKLATTLVTLVSIVHTGRSALIHSTESNVQCDAQVQSGERPSSWGHLYVPGQLGEMEFFTASFSGNFPCGAHRLVLADPIDACGDLSNAKGELVNSTVLVTRGTCSFTDKHDNLKKHKAIGMILVNTEDSLFAMGGEVSLPHPERLAAVAVRPSTGKMLERYLELTKAFNLPPIVELQGQVQYNFARESSIANCGVCVNVHDPSLKDLSPLAKLGPVSGGELHVGKQKFEFLATDFGSPMPLGVDVPMVLAEPLEGCDDLQNPDQVLGKAVYIKRGTCTFVEKLQHALDAGARLVVFGNTHHAPITLPGCTPENLRSMHPEYAPGTQLPSVIISHIASDELEGLLKQGSTSQDVTIQFHAGNLDIEDFDTIEELYDMDSWKPTPQGRQEQLNERLATLTEAVSTERAAVLKQLAARAAIHNGEPSTGALEVPLGTED